MVNSKDIEENSNLKYPRLFLFRKNIDGGVDTVNELLMYW